MRPGNGALARARRPLATPVAAYLAAAAGLLPGCGGDGSAEPAPLSTKDYEAELQALSADFGERFTSATSRLNPRSSSPELTAAGEEARAAAADTATSLERIEPPEQAAGAHRRLTAVFEDYAAALGRAREGGDAAAIAGELETASARFQEDLGAAAEELRRAGLDVSEPAGAGTATEMETAP